MIGDVLRARVAECRVSSAATAWPKRAPRSRPAPVDLVTTALVLPDSDGLALARAVREAAGQAYVPVIVVSGDVQDAPGSAPLHRGRHRLLRQGAWATTRWPHSSAATCSRSRSRARACCTSRTASVVALATRRMLETPRPRGDALRSASRTRSSTCERIAAQDDAPGADLVLTDVYLKGELSGNDLLQRDPRRLRLRQAPPAGAGDDRRRQPRQPERRCCAPAPTTWCSSRSRNACW